MFHIESFQDSVKISDGMSKLNLVLITLQTHMYSWISTEVLEINFRQVKLTRKYSKKWNSNYWLQSALSPLTPFLSLIPVSAPLLIRYSTILTCALLDVKCKGVIWKKDRPEISKEVVEFWVWINNFAGKHKRCWWIVKDETAYVITACAMLCSLCT